jgi:hypothetical protein
MNVAERIRRRRQFPHGHLSAPIHKLEGGREAVAGWTTADFTLEWLKRWWPNLLQDTALPSSSPKRPYVTTPRQAFAFNRPLHRPRNTAKNRAATIARTWSGADRVCGGEEPHTGRQAYCYAPQPTTGRSLGVFYPARELWRM